MKRVIQAILVVLMLLVCAWGGNNITNEIGQPICPGPLCGEED